MNSLPNDASADQSNCPEGYYRRSNGMVMQKPEQPDKSALPVGIVSLGENLKDAVDANGLTYEHNQFCMLYIDKGSAKEAWEAVWGYTPSRKELRALLNNPNVIKRVSSIYNRIMQVMEQSCQVDVDLLVRELEQARQVALEEREASAAIAATMGKAKLHGLMVDRKEISMKRPEDMTEAELRQVLGAEFEEDLKRGRAIEQKSANE